MTCETCGEKPKKCGNCNKDFPRAVIEINNPEVLTLLRKVVIPLSMGTEEQVPPAIGKYHNVLLQYEANGHIYLYSSDGIPTAITANIPQEVLDSIEELEDDVEDLQEQIDDLKNSPDVVDIVATYADLQAYDTSSLGNNDVIRVLADETHNGVSDYYRWNTSTQTWTYIGLAETSVGKSKKLTTDDYNWNSVSGDTTEPLDSVALWLLEDGMYSVPDGFSAYITGSLQADSPSGYIVSTYSTNPAVKSVYTLDAHTQTIGTDYHLTIKRNRVAADGTQRSFEDIASLNTVTTVLGDYIKKGSGAPTSSTPGEIGSLYEDSTNGELYIRTGVGASQNWAKLPHTAFTGVGGGALIGEAGLVPAPTAADAGKFLKADGTWDTAGGGGPTVVQTTGQSTNDVMSQKAVTDMVFKEGSTNQVQIGRNASIGQVGNNPAIAIGASASAAQAHNTAIGPSATASGSNGLAVGRNSTASNNNAVALGRQTTASGENSIAIGWNATATQKGQFDISTGANQTAGYSSSNYRLITGVYDPQSAHDAATKGYVDTAVAGVSTNTISSQDWSTLWQ